MRGKVGALITILALALVLTMNYLANALPINDITAGEVSDRFGVYFTPAGYVFAIWGVIYLGLIAFGIYQLLPGSRRSGNIEKIIPWFVASCILNSAWIIAWHYLYIGVALGIIVLLLLNLAVIYKLLNKKRQGVPQEERIFVKTPFSIYLAWITVATIANIFIFIDYMNWDYRLFSEGVWTGLLIGVGAILALTFVKYYRDLLFAGVFVWAFIGISVENNSETLILQIIPLGATALILIGSVILIFSRKKPGY
ncbi:TspO/MBR family protein [Isachenkonia alkalipeptolytica]|uniref:Tryptophan-rich sensory protein n=1 Tax=Isachenkonia alkalipeptolytica TaxID=2565777 RepID=A0AA43XI07_9CLOT|nr:TspO/MBR family protein [Isachenkonia alkalipeptolytica]NBG86947.1 tryptophan-rich sensory protein [Isachenkonia alkalipeptolytica]